MRVEWAETNRVTPVRRRRSQFTDGCTRLTDSHFSRAAAAGQPNCIAHHTPKCASSFAFRLFADRQRGQCEKQRPLLCRSAIKLEAAAVAAATDWLLLLLLLLLAGCRLIFRADQGMRRSSSRRPRHWQKSLKCLTSISISNGFSQPSRRPPPLISHTAAISRCGGSLVALGSLSGRLSLN